MKNADYLERTAATREDRLRWWRKARFGMFIHWGLYSQLGRHEWVMNRERIPLQEYEKLAATWHPNKGAARSWARLAKEAGMKYMVMTTKHHEGFCLWDTEQTSYNAIQHGPGRDLVREFVEACREFDLRIGFYYSLVDWHHPDGARCLHDLKARRRFLDFTRGCVRELCTNYGKIDVLWYDVAWPLPTPEAWESLSMNAMVRELQPDILINDRSLLDEDFSTPEEEVAPADEGRAWEACMTFNGSWGYMPISPDWRSVREVVLMLSTATAAQGNLLLNIGPAPDGSVPEEAVKRLSAVGKWVTENGEAMYGLVERADNRTDWMPTGKWTIKGNTAYYWCHRWPGERLAIGGLTVKVEEASLLSTGEPIAFEQDERRLVLTSLPELNPDSVADISVIKLECDAPPQQILGYGYVTI